MGEHSCSYPVLTASCLSDPENMDMPIFTTDSLLKKPQLALLAKLCALGLGQAV